MFGDFLQPTHLIFIMLVALVVLGPKRLPEVGKSLGKTMRDFRSAMAGIEEHTSDIFDTSKPQVTTPAPAAAATPAAPADDEPVVVFETETEPEPVMATASSADEPSLAGAATQESPAVAPKNDEQS